jgi:hypothetical protein
VSHHPRGSCSSAKSGFGKYRGFWPSVRVVAECGTLKRVRRRCYRADLDEDEAVGSSLFVALRWKPDWNQVEEAVQGEREAANGGHSARARGKAKASRPCKFIRSTEWDRCGESSSRVCGRPRSAAGTGSRRHALPRMMPRARGASHCRGPHASHKAGRQPHPQTQNPIQRVSGSIRESSLNSAMAGLHPSKNSSPVSRGPFPVHWAGSRTASLSCRV